MISAVFHFDRSKLVDINHRLSKGLWSVLRQIVTNAAIDDPMLILARELLGIRTGVQVGCAIGIAFQRNSGLWYAGR
jgi:hypothetical protein